MNQELIDFIEREDLYGTHELDGMFSLHISYSPVKIELCFLKEQRGYEGYTVEEEYKLQVNTLVEFFLLCKMLGCDILELTKREKEEC